MLPKSGYKFPLPTPPNPHPTSTPILSQQFLPFFPQTQTHKPETIMKLTNAGTFTQHYYSLNSSKQTVDNTLTLIPNESACLPNPSPNWLVSCHRLSSENLQLPLKKFLQAISEVANCTVFEVDSYLSMKGVEYQEFKVGDDLTVRIR